MGSITKTNASVEGGWISGDGRIYNNDECRSAPGTVTSLYYSNTYGFSLPTGCFVSGVQLRFHVGSTKGSSENVQFQIQLVQSAVPQGTSKVFSASSDIADCAGADYFLRGGSSDKWGLSEDAITTLCKATTFGASMKSNTSHTGTLYHDGFEITVYYYFKTKEETRRARVSPTSSKQETRRSKMFACNLGNPTRRASVSPVFIKGSLETKISTQATNHSGWEGGDGRIYDDDVCRYIENDDTTSIYYVYNFGLGIPTNATVRGVKIEHHLGYLQPAGEGSGTVKCRLCNGTSQVGDEFSADYIEVGLYSCADAVYKSHGGPDSDFGCTEEQLKTSNLGVSVRNDTIGEYLGWVDEDGFKLTAYYDYNDTNRRATVSVVELENVTRRAEVTSPAEASDTRRSEVYPVKLVDETRRATLISANAENVTRSSILNIATTGEPIRRSALNVKGEGEDTRRGSVIATEVKEETRRSGVLPVLGAEPTRRVKLDIVSDITDDMREASVNVTATQELTRRGSVIATEVIEDVRRSAVWPVKVVDELREASVAAVEVKTEVRRASLNVKVTDYDIRRAKVAVLAGADERAKVFVKLIWFYDHSQRRARVFVPWMNARRAEVQVATTALSRRVAQVTVSTKDHWRRARVLIYIAPWMFGDDQRRAHVSVPWINTRRAEVQVATTALSRRVAQVTVSTKDHWRRAQVFIYAAPWMFGDDQRRARVFVPWVNVRRVEVQVAITALSRRVAQVTVSTKDHWRRARVTVVTVYDGYYTGDEERRAVVTVLGGIYTRRAMVTVSPAEIIGDDERRAVVYAEPYSQDVRRASVLACFFGDIQRRALITAVTGKDEVRRSQIDVDSDYFIADEERRAVITVEVSSVTRRALVKAVAVEDVLRRSQVTSLITDYTRRAYITVYSEWYYVDEERRAKVFVETSTDTRRAIVTHIVVPNITRRAIVTAVGTDKVRRARVDIYAKWIYGWEGRRSLLQVMKEEEGTRRASVFRVLVGDDTRRTEVYPTVEGSVTRASKVGVFWTTEITRRAKVKSAEKKRVRITSVLAEF